MCNLFVPLNQCFPLNTILMKWPTEKRRFLWLSVGDSQYTLAFWRLWEGTYSFPYWSWNLVCLRFFFFKFISFWERQRQCKWGRDRERGRERIPSSSAPSVQSRTQGSNPRTVKSGPEPKPRVGRLTDWATQAPRNLAFYKTLTFPQIRLGNCMCQGAKWV